MQFTELVLASLAALPLLVDAHGNGIPGAPKIFGRRLNPQSRALATAQHMQEHSPANTAVEHESHLKRTTRCGPSYGSCGDGLCCSASGYCGTGTSYCMSPGKFEQLGMICCTALTLQQDVNSSTDLRVMITSFPLGPIPHRLHDLISAMSRMVGWVSLTVQ